MITLYTAPTPNGRKISIMLEECALPYKVHHVDLSKQEQFRSDFVALNPNSKIPVLVDVNDVGKKPVVIFESGAILIYLAEKTQSFLALSGYERYQAMGWLMWQMSGIGPIFGQLNHFARVAPEPLPYAIERFHKEAIRLCEVLEYRLGEAEYLATRYSIADIAVYPWLIGMLNLKLLTIDNTMLPNLSRWLEKIGKRPAVMRGMEIPR